MYFTCRLSTPTLFKTKIISKAVFKQWILLGFILRKNYLKYEMITRCKCRTQILENKMSRFWRESSQVDQVYHGITIGITFLISISYWQLYDCFLFRWTLGMNPEFWLYGCYTWADFILLHRDLFIFVLTPDKYVRLRLH